MCGKLSYQHASLQKNIVLPNYGQTYYQPTFVEKSFPKYKDSSALNNQTKVDMLLNKHLILLSNPLLLCRFFFFLCKKQNTIHLCRGVQLVIRKEFYKVAQSFFRIYLQTLCKSEFIFVIR